MNFYRKASRIILLAAILGYSIGCTTIKPYEKEYLLHPLMDDQKISKVTPSMLPTVCSGYEKLAAGGQGAGAGSSCPTCGG